MNQQSQNVTHEMSYDINVTITYLRDCELRAQKGTRYFNPALKRCRKFHTSYIVITRIPCGYLFGSMINRRGARYDTHTLVAVYSMLNI